MIKLFIYFLTTVGSNILTPVISFSKFSRYIVFSFINACFWINQFIDFSLLIAAEKVVMIITPVFLVSFFLIISGYLILLCSKTKVQSYLIYLAIAIFFFLIFFTLLSYLAKAFSTGHFYLCFFFKRAHLIFNYSPFFSR